MSANYFLTDKGKRSDPKRPEGKAIIEYIQEGHSPCSAEEIKTMVPSVSSPEGELDTLARAGFLRRDSSESSTPYKHPIMG